MPCPAVLKAVVDDLVGVIARKSVLNFGIDDIGIVALCQYHKSKLQHTRSLCMINGIAAVSEIE